MDPSEAESALDSAELKTMLTNQRTLLSAMGGFISEIMDLKTDETDPRKLLKLLLLDGCIDDKGMITNKDSELTLVWKEVRRLTAQQSMNRIKNLNPDIERTKIDVVEATSVEELVTSTNKSLKLTETVLYKLIDSSADTRGRINKAEQKQIRADLENEHLKLLGHDLDLQDCTKTNAWEISAFARIR
jgi:hypothetical protein